MALLNERRDAPEGIGARLREALLRPTDIASLVWARACFGLVMLWEASRYLAYGWVDKYFIAPDFHFTYYGFSWVRPWPGVGMYVHFFALGALGALIAVGLGYRLVAPLFALAFTHVFLLEQAIYLNHLYLVCLLAWLLAFMPLHRSLSVDSRLNPEIRRDWAPAWCLGLLRAQVGLVYLFGGVAKLNGDWLQARPLLQWMEKRGDYPVVGPLLAWDPTAWAMSYGGLLLDLLAWPLLAWRRSRPWMIGLLAVFHTCNELIFSIGIFPYLMMALSLLFLDPDWPRRAFPRVFGASPAALPGPPARASLPQKAGLGLIAAYLLLQVVLPLRHLAYPGNPSWTEEGHNFAWHMKLRSKSARFSLVATDPYSGKKWRIDPDDLLSDRQESKMKTRPDLILQFAHYVAARIRADGYPAVEVRATVHASLNGRPSQLLIDPERDLAKVERRAWPPADWIVPLTTPLPTGPAPEGGGEGDD